MPNRVLVRSDNGNHILISAYKAYYPDSASGERAFFEHKHAELEISSIVSGRGIYTCGKTAHPFCPGDIFLHRGNDNHYISRTCAGEALSLIALRFDPRFIWSSGGQWFDSRYLKIFMTPDLLSRSISHEEPAARVIQALLEEIFQECQDHHPSYELLVKAKLLTILANAARHFHDQLEGSPDSVANLARLPQIEKSMDYILSHLGEPLALDLLAREAAMSRSQYSSLFKLFNGVSVWDYVTHQRMNLAQYQLEYYDYPITRISENCGYNNIANFNRTFKKTTGKTPREYRCWARQASKQP